MFLSKRCNKEHNVKNGSALKLGTLHEYRKTESQQIVDKEEGLYTFNIIFDGRVTLERKWFNTVFPGFQMGDDNGIHFAGTANTKCNLFQESIDGDYVTIRDSSAQITREEFNSFIFCMSEVKNKSDCLELFPDYNDQWYINDHNAQNFANHLCYMLREKVKSEYKAGNFIVPKKTNIEKLQVGAHYRKVTYNTRHFHINNQQTPLLSEYIESMQNLAYTKPLSFQREAEYRFQLLLLVDNVIVPPTANSIFLDSKPIQQFLL